MKIFILLVSTFCYLFAQNSKLQEAQRLEALGKYKEAMILYKSIALEQQDIVLLKDVPEETLVEQQANTLRASIEPNEDKTTQSTIEQILTSKFDIYAYKDNYFLPFSYDTKQRADREQTEAKFQLSIKKPLSHDLFGFDETLYFGYTQTSWWQIYAESSPFRETNYQPEIFAFFPYDNAKDSAFKAYKVSFLHESNGQGEEKSRSWNRVYLETFFQVEDLFIIPRVWYRIEEESENDDNPDIEHYMGYGDLQLLYAYKDHTFKALFRNNLRLSDDNKGFAQLNWTFPFFSNTFGYLQLSSGYGDSLIDYDKEINRIGFGISFSR